MIRYAVGAIVFHGTKFMLVHKVKIRTLKGASDFKGEWDFPKGGVEQSDDSLTSALIRELEEETGSRNYQIIKQLAEPICFAFSKEFTEQTGYDKQMTTMFIVEYKGKPSLLKAKDNEINEILFLNKLEVLQRLTHYETKSYFEAVYDNYFN